MSLQAIRRDNGEQIIGSFETIVSKDETDCDPMGPDGTAACGRFRPWFELYMSHSISGGPGHGPFVLVVELQDERSGSFREAFSFDDLKVLRQFVFRYDPCLQVAGTNCSPEDIALLRIRYQRRLQHFLQLMEELLSPTH
jgi:hypothetical protein